MAIDNAHYVPARGLGAIDFVWVLFMLGHVSTIMPLVNELGATHFTRVLTLVSMIANEMCFDGALVKETLIANRTLLLWYTNVPTSMLCLA